MDAANGRDSPAERPRSAPPAPPTPTLGLPPAPPMPQLPAVAPPAPVMPPLPDLEMEDLDLGVTNSRDLESITQSMNNQHLLEVAQKELEATQRVNEEQSSLLEQSGLRAASILPQGHR